MRILFVTTYFEPDSGAAAVRLSRLAHLLKTQGHQITVLTTLPHYPVGQIAAGYRGRFSLVEDQDGLHVIRTWLYATPNPRISRRLISQNSFMLTAFVRGLGIQRPDVMLIEAQPVFTSLAGVLLSHFKRVPYVLNVSDLWPDHLLSVGAFTESSMIYRTARHLVDSTYRGATRIISLSPVWAEKIARYIGSKDKLSVIYNGVDLSQFHPDVDASRFREKYGLDSNKRLVTFIGTFATQYDFDAMFAVIKHLESCDDVQFVLIGSGSQAEKVDTFQFANLRHIDWISHDEIPAAWAISYLTFWSMRDEALYLGTIPAKLYEALACGVPVVGAIGGAGAQMIEDSGAGLAVTPGDEDGLIEAVTRLLEDNDFHARCREKGRQYAAANFDPMQVARKYEAVLLEASIFSP